MIKDTIGYNSAYISLNLLDELDYCLGGYGKPNIEFLFSLNTFVESFIASSDFYTSLDELNHLNLTAPALFPNGRPILNLVAREGGLKFVNGVVDSSGNEIYRGYALDRTRKEAQQDFIIDFGKKIHERYFIKSDINNVVDKIPLVTSKFEGDFFVVSEVLSTSAQLVSNLLNVARSSNIQTTLPIYLYGEQISSLTRTPYSIQSLDKIAKLHDAQIDELRKSLSYKYIPIPPFTNILLSQITSISEIPQKLSQLRADFQELRNTFVELEQEIFESATLKQQLDAFRKFQDFWAAFNRRYVDKRHRILYGTLDLAKEIDIGTVADSLIDGVSPAEAFKDLNPGKVGGTLLSKGINLFRDRKIINRFKGLTNIWELFQDSKGIGQQLKHFERLFGIQFSSADINKVHQFVKTKLTDITDSIEP